MGLPVIIYIIIVIAAIGKVFTCYQYRQLVKANFWINVAIFALLALLTLVVITEYYLDI